MNVVGLTSKYIKTLFDNISDSGSNNLAITNVMNYLVAQGADIVDLDGPLLLAEDREPPLTYDDAGVHPPARELWG